MTDLAERTEERTELVPTVEHYVCCEVDVGEPNITLCGDMSEPVCTSIVLIDEPQADDCVVCVELEQRNYCPLFGRCRYAEE